MILPLGHRVRGVPPSTPPRGDVVAVGWLAANKSPELAIDILTQLAPEVSLTFVGPSAGDTADRVRALAVTAGVADRVSFTGRLDDDDYDERIARARIGLQLRSSDRGEMSAAITDLVAHGIPTVTTLATAGPSSPGLTVVEPSVAALVDAVTPLLDDETWTVASADAVRRARSWTFDDVAAALIEWLDDVDDLAPSTIRDHSLPGAAASVSAAP